VLVSPDEGSGVRAVGGGWRRWRQRRPARKGSSRARASNLQTMRANNRSTTARLIRPTRAPTTRPWWRPAGAAGRVSIWPHARLAGATVGRGRGKEEWWRWRVTPTERTSGAGERIGGGGADGHGVDLDKGSLCFLFY
jgi:hypothetical protein